MRNIKGMTLVELLIAVTFLGICSTVILQTVGTANGRGQYARRRSLALASAESGIEGARASARSDVLIEGTVGPIGVTLPGASGNGARNVVTALVGGYANLYKVTSTVTWTERQNRRDRADSVSVATYVRAPDD